MRITIIIAWALFFFGCVSQNSESRKTENPGFSFVFMTDIHLQPGHGYTNLPQIPELSPHNAFRMAIDTANKLGADFTIFGGDMVYDVMRGQGRSDSLFLAFKNQVEAIDMPVYYTIGNHELYGIYQEGMNHSETTDYKYGMFERHFGKTYYSFNHKGWHFIVLNSLEVQENRYIGLIPDEQMEWLRKDLMEVGPEMPVIVTTHIPLVSVQRQVLALSDPETVPNEQWIYNRKEILDLFSGYNVKMVLQGHLHFTEDNYVYSTDTHFITGPAIAGRPSWQGFRNGEPSGFLVVHVNADEVSWNFIDFGWREHVKNHKVSP